MITLLKSLSPYFIFYRNDSLLKSQSPYCILYHNDYTVRKPRDDAARTRWEAHKERKDTSMLLEQPENVNIATYKWYRGDAIDSATGYSTHTCSTLLRLNYENGVLI
jgi:hypothetical protein